MCSYTMQNLPRKQILPQAGITEATARPLPLRSTVSRAVTGLRGSTKIARPRSERRAGQRVLRPDTRMPSGLSWVGRSRFCFLGIGQID